MNENILGRNIARERKNQSMTQEQLAEFSDLTVNYLSKIERGIAKRVSADSLFKISHALNISMDSLFTDHITSTYKVYKGPYQRQLDNYFSTLGFDKTEKICKHLLMILELSSNN